MAEGGARRGRPADTGPTIFAVGQRETMMATRYLALIPALVLAGCVTVPSGPTVMVLPGTSKTFDAFQADNFACQQFAQASLGLGGPPGQPVADQTAANAAVAATLIGAAAGAAIGSVSGQAGQCAAIGAGTGLLFG